ncbi:gefF [Symbiodinium sp. KB8]|nr:gefF [Symbiodinium sp. KB8]
MAMAGLSRKQGSLVAYQAACACSGVKVMTYGGPMQITNCHCDACHAATGHSYAIWAAYPLSRTLLIVNSPLRSFRISENGADRFFCGRCGCSVAMQYHPNSVWPEYHTVWLARHFAELTGGCDEVHIFREDEPMDSAPLPTTEEFQMPPGPRQDQGAAEPVAAGTLNDDGT